MKIHSVVRGIKNWLDWTPVDVSGPYKSYYTYADKGRVLLGYTVRVTYRYHGNRSYLFATDEEKLGLVTHAHAYARALRFHDKIQKQIEQGKQK